MLVIFIGGQCSGKRTLGNLLVEREDAQYFTPTDVNIKKALLSNRYHIVNLPPQDVEKIWSEFSKHPGKTRRLIIFHTYATVDTLRKRLKAHGKSEGELRAILRHADRITFKTFTGEFSFITINTSSNDNDVEKSYQRIQEYIPRPRLL